MNKGEFLDSFQHKGMRKNMVDELRKKGIEDERVLEAMANIPRHLFIHNSIFDKKAYEDRAFPIGEGQTISQPFTVAFQTQLLQIKKGHKVLEIGTGSGYQTAVLLELGARVFTIEYQEKLFTRTSDFLTTLKYNPSQGYNPKFFRGDGSIGLLHHAPFDRIIVTAGAPFVPEKLLNQLAIHGVLVIPVGDQHSQKMMQIKKMDNHTFEKTEWDNFRFVPLLGKEGW